MIQTMRRLYPRGAANRGVCVDADGATLGPDWALVERTLAGYEVTPRTASRDVQKVLLLDRPEPDWLYQQGQRIADALNRGEIALAQIYGLRIPIGDIDQRQLKQLAALADLRKAGFNPDEPRVPAGQPGGGEWTTGGDGEGADGGDSGNGNWTDGGDSGAAGVPMPALLYMGEPDGSSAMPLVGGRWPAPVGANPNPLFFPAQAEDDENSRGGGLLGDFMDLPIEFRQEVYEGLRARLEAIEPGNPALQTLTGPDYSPTQDDIDSLSEALREAQERAGGPPDPRWQQLGWSARGFEFEWERLAGDRELPSNTPTIDGFSYNVALSIKSIDLNAPWYGNPANLSRLIDRYVDQLTSFDNMNWGGIRIVPDQIAGKVLDIVVPMHSGTPVQQQVIERSTARARRLGVYVIINYY